ncbi:MAG: hypothetical protein HQL40_19440 [Alphaproteobacteria bacterium]|nr:hypothetical protein [Alphaproteobacteria bacterium]
MSDDPETNLFSAVKIHEAWLAFQEAEASTDGAVRDTAFRRAFTALSGLTSSQLDLAERLMPEFIEDIQDFRNSDRKD